MASIYLGLGSNLDRHNNISAGLDALASLLGDLTISSVYESKSVGFNGSNFFNAAVGAQTSLSIASLTEALKKIENDNGRIRSGAKYAPRSLDIDVLTYDNFVGTDSGVELPREEMVVNAFVLLPMAEIAPHVKHPQLCRTYAEIWADYDKESQALWPIEFVWRGKKISPR